MIIKEKKSGDIKVSKPTNPFVQINNSIFEDERLSFKAKGLLGYLISKPNNWSIKIHDLYKKSRDGFKSIRSGLIELTLTGYVELKTQYDEKTNTFIGRSYIVYEKPLFKKGFRKLENKNKSYKKGEELTPTSPLENNRKVRRKTSDQDDSNC